MSEVNKTGDSDNDDDYFDHKLPNFLPKYDDHKIMEDGKKVHKKIVEYKGSEPWEDEYNKRSKNGKRFRTSVERDFTGILTGNDKTLKLMWRDIDMIIRSMYENIERNFTEIESHYEKRMKFLEGKNFRLEKKLSELAKKNKV